MWKVFLSLILIILLSCTRKKDIHQSSGGENEKFVSNIISDSTTLEAVDEITDSIVTLSVGEKYEFIYERVFSDIGLMLPSISIIKENKMSLPTRGYGEGGKYVQFFYTAVSLETVVLQIQERDPRTNERHTTLRKELHFVSEKPDSIITTFLLNGLVKN